MGNKSLKQSKVMLYITNIQTGEPPVPFKLKLRLNLGL